MKKCLWTEWGEGRSSLCPSHSSERRENTKVFISIQPQRCEGFLKCPHKGLDSIQGGVLSFSHSLSTHTSSLESQMKVKSRRFPAFAGFRLSRSDVHDAANAIFKCWNGDSGKTFWRNGKRIWILYIRPKDNASFLNFIWRNNLQYFRENIKIMKYDLLFYCELWGEESLFTAIYLDFVHHNASLFTEFIPPKLPWD